MLVVYNYSWTMFGGLRERSCMQTVLLLSSFLRIQRLFSLLVGFSGLTYVITQKLCVTMWLIFEITWFLPTFPWVLKMFSKITVFTICNQLSNKKQLTGLVFLFRSNFCLHLCVFKLTVLNLNSAIVLGYTHVTFNLMY